MICPNCNSSDMKRVSLIHADGLYESCGRIRGFFLGHSDGLLFGKYRGKNQSRLSAMLSPPRKLPYASPLALWLAGFFLVMAFVGGGKLSLGMSFLSALYILSLPAYLIGALCYNLAIQPKKFKHWNRKFMCQRCGAIAFSDDGL
jgi:hypothetical protein